MRNERMEAAMRAVFVLYLAADVFAGPLRFYLSQSGLAALAYAPSGAMLLVVVLAALRRWISTPLAVVGCGLLVSAGLGIVSSNSPPQVLFGAWLLMPFLFGIVAYGAIVPSLSRLQPVFLTLFIAAVAGVGIDYFVEFPWAGANYSLGGVSIEVSRQWTMFGYSRLAGFSRFSYAAATQVLVLALLVITLARSSLLSLVVWSLAGVAIVVTTTKGVTTAYAVLTGFLLVWRFVPGWMWAVPSLMIAAVGISLPLGSAFGMWAVSGQGELYNLIFSSFEDRLQVTWPHAFRVVSEHGSWLFGRGLGGIGTSQRYFEPGLYNPGDSVAMFLYGCFGVLSIPILLAYAGSIWRLQVRFYRSDRFICMFTLFTLIYGLTTSVVEYGLINGFIGLHLSHLFHARNRDRRAARPAGVSPLEREPRGGSRSGISAPVAPPLALAPGATP